MPLSIEEAVLVNNNSNVDYGLRIPDFLLLFVWPLKSGVCHTEPQRRGGRLNSGGGKSVLQNGKISMDEGDKNPELMTVRSDPTQILIQIFSVSAVVQSVTFMEPFLPKILTFFLSLCLPPPLTPAAQLWWTSCGRQLLPLEGKPFFPPALDFLCGLRVQKPAHLKKLLVLHIPSFSLCLCVSV